jgi:hypothetical protein
MVVYGGVEWVVVYGGAPVCCILTHKQMGRNLGQPRSFPFQTQVQIQQVQPSSQEDPILSSQFEVSQHIIVERIVRDVRVWCMVVYGGGGGVWWCMVVYGGGGDVWWCMVVYGGVGW